MCSGHLVLPFPCGDRDVTGAVSEEGQGSELETLTVPSGRVPSCTHKPEAESDLANHRRYSDVHPLTY